MAISKKCAVLLCRFQDTMSEPILPMAYFQQLFLGSGNGSLADYWKDVSLGEVNLNGSKIFDWKNLPIKLVTVMEDFDGRLSRMRKVLTYFPEVKESDYDVVIVIYNGEADSGAQGKAIWASKNRVRSHTFLAHEIGHAAFNMNHSFDLSNRKNATWASMGAYYDRFDLMSAMNGVHMTSKTIRYSGESSEVVRVGPRLCAFYLSNEGWVPNNRIRKVPVTSGRVPHSEQITLVSMSRHGSHGTLIADLGAFLVEFRTKEGWDANIPAACILIHGVKKNDAGALVPWIIAPDLANPDLQHWLTGTKWRSNRYYSHFKKGGLCMNVDHIDPTNHQATITLSYTPAPVFSNFKLKIERKDNQVFVAGSFDINGWNACNAPEPKEPYLVRIKLKGADNALRFNDDTKYECPLMALKSGSNLTPTSFSFKQVLPAGVLDEDDGHGLIPRLKHEREKDEIYAEAEIEGYGDWTESYHSNTVEGWF